MQNTEIIKHIISKLPEIEEEQQRIRANNPGDGSFGSTLGSPQSETLVELRDFMSKLSFDQLKCILAIKAFGKTEGEPGRFDQKLYSSLFANVDSECVIHDILSAPDTIKFYFDRALEIAARQGDNLDQI